MAIEGCRLIRTVIFKSNNVRPTLIVYINVAQIFYLSRSDVNVLEGYLIIIGIRVRAAVGKADKSVCRCLSGYIVTVTYTESSGQADIFKYEGLIINRTDTVAIEEAGSIGAVNSIEILDRQIVRRF